MPDQYDRPSPMDRLLVSLEAWLKADVGVAAIVTKDVGEESVVDVAQGITPRMPAPCVRLTRDDQGDEPLTTWTIESMPASLVVGVVCCSQSEAPRDKDLSAAGSWDALGTLEAAVKAALRRFFAPSRDITSILGGPYKATASTAYTDGNYWPVVASEITIKLNKQG